MKINSRGHRHLIYIVKRNTKIDGMDFKVTLRLYKFDVNKN